MRPVPPVFQPEVAASAIFKVAQKPVRELWVGSSTVQSIVGQFLFPGFLDRLMVKKAWEGQMTDTLNADDRQDYLDQPVNDLHKIHGHFTDEAKERAISVTSGMPGKCCSAPLPSRARSWPVCCSRGDDNQRSAVRSVQNQR